MKAGTTILSGELSREEIQRYGRHLTLPQVGLEGQVKLKAASMLLVGAGGLGSPLGLYLAAAGVGRLGLVDFDRVEITNLQRQVLYGQADLGRPKVEAARQRLSDVNPHVDLRIYDQRLSIDNVEQLVAAYDIVIDGSDNFATRYLVNDACVLAGKPDVWGAVFRFEGQASVFWAERGPCYRCLFPEPPPAGSVPSCAEGGVLGVLPGIVGALQANEAIKLALAIGEPLIGRLLTFDALAMRFRELQLAKAPDCPLCSLVPAQRRLVPYEPDCELPAAPPSAQDDEPTPLDITVEDLDLWRQQDRSLVLVDVRERLEHNICRLPGSLLMPLRELPSRLGELQREALIVVHCHHGPRSAQAVAFLRQEGFTKATNLAGGIDSWSLRIDPLVPRY